VKAGEQGVRRRDPGAEERGEYPRENAIRSEAPDDCTTNVL
jgi:hypothetical protein